MGTRTCIQHSLSFTHAHMLAHFIQRAEEFVMAILWLKFVSKKNIVNRLSFDRRALCHPATFSPFFRYFHITEVEKKIHSFQ